MQQLAAADPAGIEEAQDTSAQVVLLEKLAVENMTTVQAMTKLDERMRDAKSRVGHLEVPVVGRLIGDRHDGRLFPAWKLSPR